MSEILRIQEPIVPDNEIPVDGLVAEDNGLRLFVNDDPLATQPEVQAYPAKDTDRQAETPTTLDARQRFRNQAKQVPVLTRDQEIYLARLIECGDEEAKRKLFEANMRLLDYVANKLTAWDGGGLDFMELVDEGAMGLMQAIDTFDYRKGKFITHAQLWIMQSVTRAKAKQEKTIRVPRGVQARERKIRRFSERYQAQFGRTPTDLEICAGCNLTEEKVNEARDYASAKQSLDQNISLDENGTMHDLIPDPNSSLAFDLFDDTQELYEAMKGLTERERWVLEQRFGLRGNEERTLAEIGVELGVGRERARQIESEALDILRHGIAHQLYWSQRSSQDMQTQDHTQAPGASKVA